MDNNTNTTPPNGRVVKTAFQIAKEIESKIRPYTFKVQKWRQQEAYNKWCRHWKVTAGDIQYFNGPSRFKTERWLRNVEEFSATELYSFCTAFVETIKVFGLKTIFKIEDTVPTINEVYEDIKRILEQPRFEEKTVWPEQTFNLPIDFGYTPRPETPVQVPEGLYRPLGVALEEWSLNYMDDNSGSEAPRRHYHGRVAFAPRGMAPRAGW